MDIIESQPKEKEDVEETHVEEEKVASNQQISTFKSAVVDAAKPFMVYITS